MWWTSAGERVLNGTEWDLFREGLSCLWDDVEASEEEDGPGTTGIAVFDETPKAERLALAASMAKGLTGEDAPYPDRTALTAGIFAHICYLTDVEIEIQEDGIAPEGSVPQRVHRRTGCANCPCSRLRSVNKHEALDNAVCDLNCTKDSTPSPSAESV